MNSRPPSSKTNMAPGAPGISPTWSSSAKEMVGCSLGPSRLWFTIGGGIINEVYYPRIDIPQIRDLGFIVADNSGFWVEVKRMDAHELRLAAPGVPAVTVCHRHERFELILRITPDPHRDVLLIETTLRGDESLRLYVLLAPHLGGTGHDNYAETSVYRGRRVLWAERAPFGIALIAADDQQREVWGRTSAGYVGRSDGWQDFSKNGAMHWEYGCAGPGNVSMMGELPHHAVLALGMGSSKQSAATLAATALLQPFENLWLRQISDWEAWHAVCARQRGMLTDISEELKNEMLISAMVLRVHQDKTYPGAMVASLSVPWGNSRDERGGYHLVWPRDLVECAGALLAMGGEDDARDILRYLIATQHGDGHWYQNQWLSGEPYWQGVQLDEAAFPVLLAASLSKRGALDGIQVSDMIRQAIGFIARTGPASEQDRWEEDAGINTFTLAVCIASLVAGAGFLEPRERDFALALADYWNANIERWTVVRDTPLSRQHNVKSYYIREAPVRTINDGQGLLHVLPIKNLIKDPGLRVDEQVGVDFLQLVRFGLRRADDPLILDTIKVVDSILKVETPTGSSWHRYNGDGYGEQADGAPFNGTGQGRAWPLLTGERGHYQLAAGEDPLPYLKAMISMSSLGGMIPEQIWDSEPVPGLRLKPGRPSGSAMPLVWAHAEFIKLLFSRQLGRPFDRPDAVWERYRGLKPHTRYAFWFPQAPISKISPGVCLKVCLYKPSVIHYGFDGWRNPLDIHTEDSGLGMHVAEIDTGKLNRGQRVVFTFKEIATGRWNGTDYSVTVTTK